MSLNGSLSVSNSRQPNAKIFFKGLRRPLFRTGIIFSSVLAAFSFIAIWFYTYFSPIAFVCGYGNYRISTAAYHGSIIMVLREFAPGWGWDDHVYNGEGIVPGIGGYGGMHGPEFQATLRHPGEIRAPVTRDPIHLFLIPIKAWEGTPFWNHMGFLWMTDRDHKVRPGELFSGYQDHIQSPMWPFALAPTLIAAALWLHKTRKQSRNTCGLCTKCTYDLRSHAPGGKCPECGTPILPHPPAPRPQPPRVQ